MPKLRAPQRLETLAVRALTTFVLCDLGDTLLAQLARKPQPTPTQSVARSATVELQRRVRLLQSYLDYNVPAPAFDTVCEEFFARFPAVIARIKKTGMSRSSMAQYLQKVNIIVKLAECLASGQLTRLDFELMPKMIRPVFYDQLERLRGLRSLNLSSLSGGWKTEDMEPTVLGGIVHMPHLQYFCLNYDCTDAILLTLAECCPQLHTLDVSSSKCVSNDSVNLLYQFERLRCVQLYRTAVTMEGYINLLMRMPHLHDVGRYDEIGRVLDYIVAQRPDRSPFGLRRFTSRFVTSACVQLLAEHCPELRFVSIFHNALLCDLMLLCGVNRLAELRLLSCDFFADQVRDVLHVKGCNLTHLHLEHVDEVDMNALMYISQYCADLQELTFYNCEMVASTSMAIKKPAVPPFMNLRRLTLIALCDERHVEFLLGGCLRVEMVRLGSMVPTTDALMERVLGRNPMRWLREFRVMCSEGLSVATAYRLVEVCPALEALNEVDGWQGSGAPEWEAFRVFVRDNNVDVCLSSKTFAD